MQPNALVALFDQQAPGYDRQWAKTAAIRDCMYLLLEPLLAGLPEDAHVLCVGVGTGQELAHLAKTFPRWQFVAVDPSGAMIDACRTRAEAEGFAGRCRFHHGFLESLPTEAPFDAATCFLVSQFLVDRAARVRFFAGIAARLRPDGLLASSDLAFDTASPGYDVLLPAWMRMMSMADVSPEALQRIREAYGRDVAVLPPREVAAILEDGGFERPVPFFQAGLIHGWVSRVPA
ncbi:class I SAM-dependent methyltransferase [Luteimonas terrae]|uniref:tRNA (Cmo5U34)-methyltransferase n=1 Tax=Luteimonas terrae TaxID=1530191 RepID=A0ABU1XSQ9_9GAMM|nr:class I SAM-dependent methyltransferase [Luteimonas terrae]MDR7191790.1 tRNA (cmo5U34)-methyltransferase [Luteimonas terrae]